MKFFNPEFWAIWCALAIILMAAIINARTLIVPNRLSLPAAVAGWSVAVAVSCSIGIPSNGGGIRASLASAAVGFVLLIPLWLAGYLGAGCVKMQLAFGAWVGCALTARSAVVLTASGTLTGVVVTAIASGVAVSVRRAGTDGLHKSKIFPAQVTLSIGSVVGAIISLACGWA